MPKDKKVETLLNELIKSQLEIHLSKMIRKSTKKAQKEKAKLGKLLRMQLPYRKDNKPEEKVIDVEPELRHYDPHERSREKGIKDSSGFIDIDPDDDGSIQKKTIVQ